MQRGQPVVVLSNPELWAAVGVARAEVDKARSDRDRVYAGVRDEQVQALQQEIDKAQAVHTQAAQELARKSVLAMRSDASVQELDTATAAESRASADIAVAEARYAEAQRGPTVEERALADAAVTLAEAARDVVEARAAKMLLRAPASGTVAILAAEVGEAVVSGAPCDNGSRQRRVVRLQPARGRAEGPFDLIRCSDPRGGTGGTRLREGRRDANWGEFAARRAACASGDHDLNTLFVRLDPVAHTGSLVAGQTSWIIPWPGPGSHQRK